jgi:replicative DNA helicase
MRLEKSILSNLVNNEDFTRKAIPYLKEEYFHDPEEKLLFNLVEEHIKTYNTLPSREILSITLENSENLGNDLYKSSLEYVSELTSSEKDMQWLLDKTEEFCQEKAVYNAIMDSIQILDGRDDKQSKTAIPDILSKALGVSFDSHIGHDWLEDFAERFDFYHKVEERVPFDIEYLNLITKGGLPKKTLSCILAGTNVGKSLAMCHMASANILDGKNVLYITCEMAEERIAERIDANLLDVPISDIEGLPKAAFEKKIQRVASKTNGKLIIKEYPPTTAGAGHFRHLLNELKLKRNFSPDIIYIDYLNICASMRLKYGSNVNSYMYIKSVAEELRGLAVERGLPIMTATQTNRTGYTSSDPGLEDTSESFGLPATVDLMIALITSEELEGLGQLKAKQLKNRLNDVTQNRAFLIGVDRSRMRLYDVEQDAQEGMPEDDKSVMDNSPFGERANDEGKRGKKFNMEGFR